MSEKLLYLFLTIFFAIAGGFIADVIITAIRKKESVFAALTEAEQNWVAEAKRGAALVHADLGRGEAIVEGVVQRVDASLVSALHDAEKEGTVIAGTVKTYVEKYLGISQTVTTADPAPTPVSDPAPATPPTAPMTLTIEGTPEQIAAAQLAAQQAGSTAPVIIHATTA